MKSDSQMATELRAEKMKLLIKRMDSISDLRNVACDLIDTNTRIKGLILQWAEMGWAPKTAEPVD